MTARNESQRVTRRRNFQVPVSHERLDYLPELDARPLDDALLASEEAMALWEAFDRLPIQCRVLLRMLMSDPPPSYSIVSETLGMPVGSIGPRRGRCLERLRDEVEHTVLDESDLVLHTEGGER